jgi:hypothetical protein
VPGDPADWIALAIVVGQTEPTGRVQESSYDLTMSASTVAFGSPDQGKAALKMRRQKGNATLGMRASFLTDPSGSGFSPRLPGDSPDGGRASEVSPPRPRHPAEELRQVAFAPADLETAEVLSRMLRQTTVHLAKRALGGAPLVLGPQWHRT